MGQGGWQGWAFVGRGRGRKVLLVSFAVVLFVEDMLFFGIAWYGVLRSGSVENGRERMKDYRNSGEFAGESMWDLGWALSRVTVCNNRDVSRLLWENLLC